MAVNIRSEDGKVSITADDGSRVENIWVDGKRIVGGSRRPGIHWGSVLLVALVGVVLVVLVYGRIALGSPLVPGTGMTGGHPGLRSGLDCLDIKDPDARHFCLALAKHDKLECEFIKDSGKRAECRGLAGGR